MNLHATETTDTAILSQTLSHFIGRTFDIHALKPNYHAAKVNILSRPVVWMKTVIVANIFAVLYSNE
jgi:hypothetical protein